jgi:alanyl-tRNA synthetase
MTSGEIRLAFLEFFEAEGHRIVSSSSLVPIDDPTLLFTNAGMNQFKDLFLGKGRKNYTRATTSQKCMRVSGKHNDLENVGPSLSHHTFFEMLGNFSFGDYFKADAIPFAWRLLTDVWHLPTDRLHATIFKGEGVIPRDDEAYELWRRHLPEERIVELGLSENFWTMGETGPCGRCSEIHYHRGDHLTCLEKPSCRGIDCSCDRYVEIWNNVFMEFERKPDKTLTPLPEPSIDTGMGLERIVAVLQGTLSNYDTDLFLPLLEKIGDTTGTVYGPLVNQPANTTTDVSIRVVADHLRAMTFLIADGVLPSNEWRGYVLRKIMRRAMRHGKRLGMAEPFLSQLVDVIVSEMQSAYPELHASRDSIVHVIENEEQQFNKVLNDGLPRLEATLAAVDPALRTITGDEVFQLYDTYGLPLDFIEDLAITRQIGIDHDGFERAMSQQRSRSRERSRFKADGIPPFAMTTSQSHNDLATVSDEFIGYDETKVEKEKIAQLFREDGKQTGTLETGDTGFVLIARTPFYLEAGGQVSDRGRIYASCAEATVDTVIRPMSNWPRMHVVAVTKGSLSVGQLVTAEVDRELRDATRRNHTATHLLHAALRHVVGTHVKQAGSLVAPDRLRFDLTHFKPLSPDQLAEIEYFVNAKAYDNQLVKTDVRATAKAIADGAIALFGEKYGEHVRVVTVPEVSTELCAGTHCRATGEIGPFVITQEAGVAAGIRRIEALTGNGAVNYLRRRRDTLNGILHALEVTDERAVDAIKRLQVEVKRLNREVDQLKVRVAIGSPPTEKDDDVAEVQGVKVVNRRVSGLQKKALRALADSLRDWIKSGVVILASQNENKVTLLVSVTKDLTGRVHAGNVVQAIAPIVGGKGGGRPDFAEAGGLKPEKLDALFQESKAVLNRMLTKTSES